MLFLYSVLLLLSPPRYTMLSSDNSFFVSFTSNYFSFLLHTEMNIYNSSNSLIEIFSFSLRLDVIDNVFSSPFLSLHFFLIFYIYTFLFIDIVKHSLFFNSISLRLFFSSSVLLHLSLR